MVEVLECTVSKVGGNSNPSGFLRRWEDLTWRRQTRNLAKLKTMATGKGDILLGLSSYYHKARQSRMGLTLRGNTSLASTLPRGINILRKLFSFNFLYTELSYNGVGKSAQKSSFPNTPDEKNHLDLC